MRILSIVQGVWGGVGQYACLLQKIDDGKHVKFKTIVINSPKWPCHRHLLERNGVDEYVIRSRIDFSWITGCVDEINNYKPDLLLYHGFNGTIMAMLIRWRLRRKIPIICSYHGEYCPPSIAKKIISPLINGLVYFIYRRYADLVITVSQFSKMALVSKRVDAEKIAVVHNGIDINYIPRQSKTQIRESWGIPTDAYIIGCAGRFTEEKGIYFLIMSFKEILQKNSNCFLVLAGNGPLLDPLQMLSRKLGVYERIAFLGLIDDVDSFLNGIDIYVLPSMYENHSIGLIEAMRASKAIIATEVGGNPESIRNNRDGLLIPAADVSAMTNAVVKLIDDKQLSERLGHSARLRFEENFLEKIMLEKTSQLLCSFDKKYIQASGNVHS